MTEIVISWQSGPSPGHEAGLLPQDLAIRRFEWRVEPWPVEAGMPEPVMAALADALAETGPVAGHWDGAPPPHATLFPTPRRGRVRRVWDRLVGRWVSDVLVSDRPAAIALLIELGWANESQVLLMLEPGRDPSPAVALLAARRDWREVMLPQMVRAILLPGSDGDSVLIGASDLAGLEALARKLDEAFRAAGFGTGLAAA